jgi:hypothetical protein
MASADTPGLEPVEVGELQLTMGGTWTVHSTSDTVYRLDLDRALLRREPGTRSKRAPGDDAWVPLFDVHSYVVNGDDTLTVDLEHPNVITVGRRHLYTLDPEPGTAEPYRWWLQRTATQILRADDEHRDGPAT